MPVFPLISEKRTTPYKIILVIWNLGILMGIVSIFLEGIMFNIFLCTFLLTTVVWIIGNLVITKFTIIGNIQFDFEHIRVSTGDKMQHIDISSAKNLVLKYFGVKGEPYGVYAGLFRIKDGSGNTISLKIGDHDNKFEFLVTKRSFLYSIYPILKYWKKKGLDIMILDRHKKDITVKVFK